MAYFNHQSLQKARKPHRCDFCETIIEKGERYSRTMHNPEGEFCCWKEHEDCHSAGREIMRLTGEDFYTCLSDYEGDFNDLFQEKYPSILARRSRINQMQEICHHD